MVLELAGEGLSAQLVSCSGWSPLRVSAVVCVRASDGVTRPSTPSLRYKHCVTRPVVFGRSRFLYIVHSLQLIFILSVTKPVLCCLDIYTVHLRLWRWWGWILYKTPVPSWKKARPLFKWNVMVKACRLPASVTTVVWCLWLNPWSAPQSLGTNTGFLAQNAVAGKINGFDENWLIPMGLIAYSFLSSPVLLFEKKKFFCCFFYLFFLFLFFFLARSDVSTLWTWQWNLWGRQ